MSTFFSPNALNSLRSAGYRNAQYALAELIDNSFDADANWCKVVFFEGRDFTDRKVISEVVVGDDGKGMDKEQASICLQFGNTGNKRIGRNSREEEERDVWIWPTERESQPVPGGTYIYQTRQGDISYLP